MFLFIFESFGTSELILIGLVALIVFGPRKLPQLARTIGKTMADFKKTTNDFKETWEKEVNFEDNDHDNKSYDNKSISYGSEVKNIEKPIEPEQKQLAEGNSIASPKIKELSSEEAEKILASQNKVEREVVVERNENDKRSWL